MTNALEQYRATVSNDKSDEDNWVILKTYVSLALHSKRYETRLKQTVEVCNVLLISDVHYFEKHPTKMTARTPETTTMTTRALSRLVREPTVRATPILQVALAKTRRLPACSDEPFHCKADGCRREN